MLTTLATLRGTGLATLVGALGFLLRDPSLALAWLAIVVVPVGWALGARRTPPLAAGLVPFLWLVIAWLRIESAPTLAMAGCTWIGLFGAGYAGGLWLPSGAVLAGLVAACLSWLPGLGWSPAVAARLLSLSPATLVIESAGFDWMRHPAVYEPVGVDAIGPRVRLPWRGKLAGPVVLLVGCGLSMAAGRTRMLTWRPASSSAPSPRT